MKKILLFSVMAAGSIGFANAQGGPPSYHSDWGTQIGQTYYDLQSNGASGNRIIRLADGRIAATWTESCLSSPGNCDPNALSGCTYPDRGAGYNLITNNNGTVTTTMGPDGTCNEAGSMYGIFPNRVGWPEIIQLANGDQVVFAHSPIKMVTMPASGNGEPNSWTYNANPFGLATGATTTADTWPRAVNSGNYIHLIATCNACTPTTGPDAGVSAPIRYFRSTDNGSTWDKVDVTLPGLTPAAFPEGIGADAYAIHANGANVAIIAGDGGSDWVMWKSSNNGDTWTTHTMRHFRGAVDTVDLFGPTSSPDNVQYISNDRFMSVVVTNNGEAHAFAGEQVVVVDRDSLTFKNRYYPGASLGLWHWSSNMGENELQYVDLELEDLTPDDTTDFELMPETAGNYQSGYIGMPAATTDQNNNVYVIYSKVLTGTNDTGDPTTGQNYRNLYGAGLASGSTTFGPVINLAAAATGGGPGEFEESVFPSVIKSITSDNLIHIVYQNDDMSGLRIQADYDPELLNRIVYAGFDKALIPLIVGMEEEMKTLASAITVMPNPTSENASVKVDLLKDAKVGVKVYNLLGQEVLSVPAADLFVSNNNVIELNMAAQPAGMYLLSVSVDGVIQTERLVKQ